MCQLRHGLPAHTAVGTDEIGTCAPICHLLRRAHGTEYILLFCHTRDRVTRSEFLGVCDETQLLTRITTIQLTKSPPPMNLHVYTGEILVLQENLFLYRVQKGVCELV